MSPGMSHSGCRRLPRRQRRVAPSAFWNAWNNTKIFSYPSSERFSLVSITIEFHILVLASCIHIAFAGRTTVEPAFAGARCPLGVFLELFRAVSFCPIISLFPNFFFSTFWDRNFSAFQRGGRKTHERLGMTNERVRRTTVRITTNRKEGPNARF